jgi:hypothetical protein
MEGKWFSFSVSFTNFVLVILATCYNYQSDWGSGSSKHNCEQLGHKPLSIFLSVKLGKCKAFFSWFGFECH